MIIFPEKKIQIRCCFAVNASVHHKPFIWHQQTRRKHLQKYDFEIKKKKFHWKTIAKLVRWQLLDLKRVPDDLNNLTFLFLCKFQSQTGFKMMNERKKGPKKEFDSCSCSSQMRIEDFLPSSIFFFGKLITWLFSLFYFWSRKNTHIIWLD